MSIIVQALRVAAIEVAETVAEAAVDEVRELVGAKRKTGKRKPRRVTSDDERKQLHKQQGRKCNGCQRSFALKDMEVDHIKALSKGGKDTITNKQLLCSLCNRRKGSGTMRDLKRRNQNARD